MTCASSWNYILEGRNSVKNTSKMYSGKNICSKYFVLTKNQVTSVHVYLFGQVLSAPYSLSANKKKHYHKAQLIAIDCKKDNDLLALKC